MKTHRWGIQTQLIMGLVAVILVSSVAAYAANLLLTHMAFDELIESNEGADLRTAAAALTSYYQVHRTWDGLTGEMGRWRLGPPEEREHHTLTVTDIHDAVVFASAPDQDGATDHPGRTLPLVVDGQVVGHLSLRDRHGGYNPREQQFLVTLNLTAVLSFAFGTAFAALLGWWLASRFVRPIRTLENAVRDTGSGRFSRLDGIRGHDEISSLSRHFNHMIDQLQAQETARQNLLADLAHELRTPVSILQANLEMLLDGVYRPDPPRLTSLLEETHLLTRLVEDLRALSDAELGASPTMLEPVAVIPLVNECLDRHRPFLQGQELTVNWDAAAPITVLTDPLRLTQVVRNLLENALKYGGPSLTVSADVPRAGWVRVSFSDTGPGVRDDELEKIFERFYRADPSRNRQTGGRGLGLAISRQFIAACGGTMGAHNQVPHGLTVWFELPLAETRHSRQAPSTPASKPRPWT